MNHQLDAAHLQEIRGASAHAARPGRALTITIVAVVTLAAVAALMTMGAELVGSTTQAEHQSASQPQTAASVHIVVVPEQDKTFHERHDANLKKAEDDGAVAPTF